MNLIKSIVKSILRKLTGYRVMTKLRQLSAISNLAAEKIANSIKDAFNNNLSSEEKVWVERIEELRRVLIMGRGS